MKIFNESNSPWLAKVNFVDQNNVMVGYDLSQDCCELADWFIADVPVLKFDKTNRDYDEKELESYYFDTKYFQEINDNNLFDNGGMIIFRITDGKSEKFIHIYNIHNGYYSHGFEFKIDKNVIESGYL